QIDYLGTVSLTGSVTALLVALLEVGESRAWTDPLVLGAIALAAGLLAVFVWAERRAPEPVLPLGLFENRVIGIAFFAGILIGAAMFGVTSYLPLYVQGVLGGNALRAGMVIAPYSVAWSLMSVPSGRMIVRFGYRVSAVAGLASMVLGGLVLQAVAHGNSLWLPALAAAFSGAGMGLSSTAFIIGAQNAVGWAQRGIATASITFSRTIGGAIGVAALGTVLSARMASGLAATGQHDANALLDPASRAALPAATVARLRDSLADSLSWVHACVLGIAALAFLIVLLAFPRGSVHELSAPSEAEEPRVPAAEAETPTGR
ncbi:MAG: MFS transporter, partial [Thermomicrobiaceae bacterium]|nr:MFS transporter [Thermomicrobiaceae bacterium]